MTRRSRDLGRRIATILLPLVVSSSCSRGPQGPTPADWYDIYHSKFQEGEALEKAGRRMPAIYAYREARDALENLKASYPRSDYLDPTDLAHVKDAIHRLEDEEKRGVVAAPAGSGPPPPEEPPLTGELYHSLRKSIEAELGTQINTEPPLDRIKQIEPHVIDRQTPGLVVQILANDRLIEGMMVQEVRRDLKKVMHVLLDHKKDLEIYPMIVVAGFKIVPGADNYAEAVLMVEYRFDQEAFKRVERSKLEDEEYSLKTDASKTIEP